EFEGGTGAVTAVATAPAGLVEQEEAISDGGRSVIVQAAAERGADLGGAAGAGVARTAEGTGSRDDTSGQLEGGAVGIEDTRAGGCARAGAAAGVVEPPRGQVAQNRTVVARNGTGRDIESAAAAEADAAGPVSGDGLVADEGAIGDGDGQSVRRVNASAPGRAAAGAAERLIADEGAVADRQAAGQVEDAA